MARRGSLTRVSEHLSGDLTGKEAGKRNERRLGDARHIHGGDAVGDRVVTRRRHRVSGGLFATHAAIWPLIARRIWWET